MQDSELDTGEALRKGMAAMNKAMMKPDSGGVTTSAGAAALDDSSAGRDASDSDADVSSTDEVMADLVQRNIAVMEGHYNSHNNNNNNNTTGATSNADGSNTDSAMTAVSNPADQQQQAGGDVSSSTGGVVGAGGVGKKKKVGGGRDVRREQSLGHLSAVFVQMFLANDARVVSLEEAARWLLRSNQQQQPQQQQTTTDTTQPHSQQQLSDSVSSSAPSAASTAAPASSSSASAGRSKASAGRDASHFKSKVRRLYDIANVLSSLKLIEKIQLIQSRRPAFRWLGAGVYPLHSTISQDAYTKDGPSGGKSSKADTANKRRTPSKQQQQQQQLDGSAPAVRVKHETAAVDNGGSRAAGGLISGISSSSSIINSGALPSQTLHSAFSSPGSLTVRTQPLSFSFSKASQSVVTPTGPSLSHVPGSGNAQHSSPAASASSAAPSASASASTSFASSFSVSSSVAPLTSVVAGGSSSVSPHSAARGGSLYWFIHHDRSFCMDASKMAEFDPLDFAYLPYIAPPGLHDCIAQQQQQQQQPHKHNTNNNSNNTAPPLPQHVSELPPSVQAAYVRDTGSFLSLFSAACKRWKEVIPDLTAISASALAAADTATASTAAPPSLVAASASFAASPSSSVIAPRARRGSVRNGKVGVR